MGATRATAISGAADSAARARSDPSQPPDAASAKRPVALVAMSGGVDSCVAAALLQDEGFEVVGATLQLWCYEERTSYRRACCSMEAIRDARAFAARRDFAHFVLNYESLFQERVVQPFLEDYLGGRTPYPCAACNADLKFGRLLEQARAIGAVCLASGHYARIGRAALRDGGEEFALYRAATPDKDQSYALWAVSRAALPFLRFPLGERTKDEVRARAEELGFANLVAKPESQDLCFVGGPGRYAAYIEEQVGAERARRPGPLLDADGNRVGVHRGLSRYTVGQRRGLGLATGERTYVVDLDPENNAVRLGPESALFASRAVTGPLNWLSHDPPRSGQRVEVQVRYRSEPAAATLFPAAGEPVGSGAPFAPEQGGELRFESPVRAVAPGQSAVLYEGDRLLGGGSLRRVAR